MEQVLIYDTTLRDGTQGEGVSLSVEDKLKIARRLDQFGVHYIEGGWPGSNPKDMEFFKKVKSLSLQNAKVAAFGSTRRKGIKPEEDRNLQGLLESGVEVATIFGKAWDFHVTDALKTTLEENLSMIYDSVHFLKENGLEVIFDAEHFFDGYKNNPEYALKTLAEAERAGADWLVLCDTNGGTLPQEIGQIIETVQESVETQIGVHCHNDSECGVANTLEAVRYGARQVQGTINGYGERCGNANLISVIPNLQIKLGYKCVEEEQLKMLTHVSRYVQEIANVVPPNNQPFVGVSAFAHKGGIHVSAILNSPETYEHIPPEQVGNDRRVLISELAGQSNFLFKAEELGYELDKSNPRTQEITQKVKDMEQQGYQYEGAEASFELLLREALGEDVHPFNAATFKILVEKSSEAELKSEAIVKLNVQGEWMHTVAEGNGPVNALDNALRKSLEASYPEIKEMYLADYKVRVLDEGGATSAKVRVLIESADGQDKWNTVGVSTNIIEASWQAICDSIRYYLSGKKKLAAPVEQDERVGIVNH